MSDIRSLWKRQARDRSASARILRGALYLGGGVATVAGLSTLVTGARSVPGLRENSDPILESELRFYSAFYAAYGLTMLAVAPRADREPTAVKALAAALLLAAGGRLAGWASVGRPNRAQLALLAIELTAPPLLARQAAAAGAGR
jgi:hypothetical protein